MNKPYITAILAITSLSFSSGAMAQNMSESEYIAAAKVIASDYKSAMAHCDSFTDNARDICIAQAKRMEKVATAKLEARYKPSRKADYAMTNAKCDATSGNARELCVEAA